MEILHHSDNRKIKALSSIDQYRDFISANVGGAYLPIEFDYIDYIDCNKVVSHPIIVDCGDGIGYDFPIGECEYTTDEYIMSERREVELRELPECLGSGFYEAFEDSDIITNADNGAVSIRNNIKLNIGQNYYLADDFLEPEA